MERRAAQWRPAVARVSHLFDPSCQACAPEPGSFQFLAAHEVREDAPAPYPSEHESGHWFHGTHFDPSDDPSYYREGLRSQSWRQVDTAGP
jgi:hypothetical protein